MWWFSVIITTLWKGGKPQPNWKCCIPIHKSPQMVNRLLKGGRYHSLLLIWPPPVPTQWPPISLGLFNSSHCWHRSEIHEEVLIQYEVLFNEGRLTTLQLIGCWEAWRGCFWRTVWRWIRLFRCFCPNVCNFLWVSNLPQHKQHKMLRIERRKWQELNTENMEADLWHPNLISEPKPTKVDVC